MTDGDSAAACTFWILELTVTVGGGTPPPKPPDEGNPLTAGVPMVLLVLVFATTIFLVFTVVCDTVLPSVCLV